MNGYYQAKSRCLKEELRLLELADLEYISEEGEITTPEITLTPKPPLAPFVLRECPRCHTVQRNVLRDPYCTDCGWDSVTDPCLEILKGDHV